MGRLIDADAIISFVDAGHLRNPLELAWSDNDVVDMIESRPTVDAVPVVRCRECKHAKDENFISAIWCENLEKYLAYDFFCHDGERKDTDKGEQ
jgi:hypothetical protein